MTTTKTRYIWNMSDIESRVSQWFSKDTLRFFQSRILHSSFTYVSDTEVYFISSERFDTQPRYYTVRRFDGDSINTVGEFNKMSKCAAQRLLASTVAASKKVGA